MTAPTNDVTRILNAIRDGEASATESLFPVVYEELRRLASNKLAREAPGQTLQPTALVHEAYIRLLGDTGYEWENRRHFFGAAAEAMRRILVDRARRKARKRHGGEHQRVEFDLNVAADAPAEELLQLDAALERLQAEEPTKAELVKLRFFAGLTGQQAAETLGISRATADRYWAYARAWLYHELKGD